MQSMQRQFGKLLNKGAGDSSKVSVILNDYEDADKVLARIIDATKSCRDSWFGMLNSQLGMMTELELLYDPIVGSSDGHGKEAVPTPQLQLDRTFRLKEAYTELRSELTDEIAQLDARIIRPATDARVAIDPIRKTIKKRENKRLDYEKAQEKVAKLHKKMHRTPKEDAALAKAEDEMTRMGEEFQIADAHLRETLPPIITTTFSLIPPLLHAMIQIQNRILAVYYTVMHQYCEDNNFPSPPPPMEDVISRWASLFRPAQRDVESIPCIARGRAVNTSMQLGEDALALRKTSTAAPPTYAPPRHRPDVVGTNGSAVRRVPSANALAAVSEPAPPPPNMQTRPDIRVSSSGLLVPTSFTQATVYNGQPVSPGTANGGGGHYSPSSPIHRVPSGDHFGGSATGSSSRPVTAQSTMSSSSTSLALQGKKKPPPPPPPKRLASAPRPPDEFVVAQYPFSGQGAGDLSFRAGDRIKIIKRTATDQDWWEGELESCPGVRGQFPANYCKVV